MNLFGREIEFVTPPVVQGARYISIPNPFGKEIIVTETVTTTWIIMLAFLLIFWWGTKDLKEKPGKKQMFFEMIYDFYDWLAGNVLSKWKGKFMPYVSALMTYLLIANIISLLPIPWLFKTEAGYSISNLFKSPTSDLNTTVGLALITAAVFLYYGIKVNGILGYMKSLLEPTPLMLPMNIIGELAKPLNISMRLFGNMLGGAVIITLLYQFSSWLFSKFYVPAPVFIVPLHLYFDIFAGIIQSFVFTMLTLVYISMAVGDSEPENA